MHNLKNLSCKLFHNIVKGDYCLGNLMKVQNIHGLNGTSKKRFCFVYFERNIFYNECLISMPKTSQYLFFDC